MFAPKGLKSDKGQNIDRVGLAPDGSSSDFSEDDTPLAVRLNSQGGDAEKQRPRAALSKKVGFVIPRKKKQANGRNFHVTFWLRWLYISQTCVYKSCSLNSNNHNWDLN